MNWLSHPNITEDAIYRICTLRYNPYQLDQLDVLNKPILQSNTAVRSLNIVITNVYIIIAFHGFLLIKM